MPKKKTTKQINILSILKKIKGFKSVKTNKNKKFLYYENPLLDESKLLNICINNGYSFEKTRDEIKVTYEPRPKPE